MLVAALRGKHMATRFAERRQWTGTSTGRLPPRCFERRPRGLPVCQKRRRRLRRTKSSHVRYTPDAKMSKYQDARRVSILY